MTSIKEFLLKVWERDGVPAFVLAMAAIVASVVLLAWMFGDQIFSFFQG